MKSKVGDTVSNAPQPFDVHKVITNLLNRTQQLLEQRDWVEEQRVQLCLSLRSTLAMLDDKEERKKVVAAIEALRRKPAGLTEAISNFLRASPYHSHSANEVREWLERGGFDLSDYSQPLATISVTLRRLAQSGRVKATRKPRKVTYQWIGDFSKERGNPPEGTGPANLPPRSGMWRSGHDS